MNSLPLYVALTVDVDPDANRPEPGRTDAVSAGAGGRVSLRACRQGLEALAALLEELHLPCTLLWEARSLRVLARTAPRLVHSLVENKACEHGCHGLRHEDFAGRDSGLPIGGQQTLEIMQEATRIVTGETGRRPAGFRAPYCRLTPGLRRALAALGYSYDATLMRTPGSHWPLTASRLRGTDGRVWELALPRGRDRSGRPITGYLWQLLEGRRRPEDHVEFAARAAGMCSGGLLQVALHPWHLLVSARGAAVRSAGSGASDLRAVLCGTGSLPAVRFATASAYLGAVQSGGTGASVSFDG